MFILNLPLYLAPCSWYGYIVRPVSITYSDVRTFRNHCLRMLFAETFGVCSTFLVNFRWIPWDLLWLARKFWCFSEPFVNCQSRFFVDNPHALLGQRWRQHNILKRHFTSIKYQINRISRKKSEHWSTLVTHVTLIKLVNSDKIYHWCNNRHVTSMISF